jgi:hypothetical protein
MKSETLRYKAQAHPAMLDSKARQERNNLAQRF